MASAAASTLISSRRLSVWDSSAARVRSPALTEAGQVVYRYADEIFTLGGELIDVLKGRPRGRAVRLVVGISDVMPKLIAYRILQPAFRLSEHVRLVCREDNPERLLLGLS